MIFRWLFLAAIFFLVRRLVLAVVGKGRGDQPRMGGPSRTRAQGRGGGGEAKSRSKDQRKRREEELAAGQRIEEADFEELD